MGPCSARFDAQNGVARNTELTGDSLAIKPGPKQVPHQQYLFFLEPRFSVGTATQLRSVQNPIAGIFGVGSPAKV
jgi:hypothetical protein